MVTLDMLAADGPQSSGSASKWAGQDIGIVGIAHISTDIDPSPPRRPRWGFDHAYRRHVAIGPRFRRLIEPRPLLSQPRLKFLLPGNEASYQATAVPPFIALSLPGDATSFLSGLGAGDLSIEIKARRCTAP